MKVYFSKDKFKSIRSVKNYITLNYKSHTNFLLQNGFDVDKCVFCDRYSKTVVEIKEEKNNWYIDSFSYYRNNKVCCSKDCVSYGMNKQSKEWLMNVKCLSEEGVKEYLSKKAKKSAAVQKENGRWNEENNVFSKQYWRNKGCSEQEIANILKEKCNKSVNTLRNNGWFDDKSNNPFSKEYWIKIGFSEDDAAQKVYERIYNRPEFWIKKGYSDSEAKKLAQNSAKRGLEHFLKKYGNEEGFRKYNEMRNKISNYYTIDVIMDREKCSYDTANEIRKEWIRKTHIRNTKFSKSSLLFFDELISDVKLNDDLFEKTYYGYNEFGHYDKELKRYYFYDFVIEPLKICIEFNGAQWHPKSPEQDWVQPNTHKSAKEVFENDERKRFILENEGYAYFVVWDDNIDENREEIIEYITNKILEYERD